MLTNNQLRQCVIMSSLALMWDMQTLLSICLLWSNPEWLYHTVIVKPCCSSIIWVFIWFYPLHPAVIMVSRIQNNIRHQLHYLLVIWHNYTTTKQLVHIYQYTELCIMHTFYFHNMLSLFLLPTTKSNKICALERSFINLLLVNI